MYGAKAQAKAQKVEWSTGVAALRAELAELLLRVEEGELQRDHLAREVSFILKPETHFPLGGWVPKVGSDGRRDNCCVEARWLSTKAVANSAIVVKLLTLTTSYLWIFIIDWTQSMRCIFC